MAANICIISLAIVFTGALAKRHFFHKAVPSRQFLSGDRFVIPNATWQGQQKTVVLALQEGCHFCADSAPFYRRLVQQASARNVKVVALFPDSASGPHEYLAGIDLPIDEVRTVDFGAHGIRGTPTVVVLGNDGTVLKSWIGRLSSARESEVLESLL
jgi:hypothetical protein